MKLLCATGILGSLVFVNLGGCSGAAGDASNGNNGVPVVHNIVVTASTTTAIMGATLTVGYTYSDPDNDAEAGGGSSIRWLRNGVAIAGATGPTHSLTLSDADKALSAEVTPLAQTGIRAGLPVVSNSVTVGPANPASVVLAVSAGLKQLHFNWAAVPGATFYRVSTNPDGVTGFAALAASSDQLTATAYDWDIGVHRINWPQAQFLLEACDADTCLPSANISALNVMLDTVGYFKASNPGSGYFFGNSVALSGDGNTLAVGAYHEASATTGINSAPNALAAVAGAVYVYTRSGTTWAQQAYVKASNTGVGDNFGDAVALSADGNTLVVGAQGEASANVGITPGAPTDAVMLNGASSSGAVYVFTRSGTLWSQQALVKASNTAAVDLFGNSIALSADGNTLAVGAYFEDGMKTGVTPGAPAETDAPNGASESGAVYVYVRSGTTWSQQAYVKASNTEANDLFGISVALSGDGNTLAVGAYAEDSANSGITVGAPNEASTLNGASFSGAVYVYIRSGTTWEQQAYVKASNTGAGDAFGSAVVLSADGNTLAVGASGESSAAIGVIPGTPNEAATGNDAGSSGAAYVMTRSGATWSQQAYVKASNTGAGDRFGFAIALNAEGNRLAVGAYNEGSANTGVMPGTPNETATLNDAAFSGAVYVYDRSAITWSQHAYVKAPNTENSDLFGRALALSADGNTLAVGAQYESSAATGVGNTTSGQSDNSVAAAGAVYLY